MALGSSISDLHLALHSPCLHLALRSSHSLCRRPHSCRVLRFELGYHLVDLAGLTVLRGGYCGATLSSKEA